MAEQLTNALITPSATLVTASITAGTTTTFSVTWAEPSPPTVGTYSLLFRGTATDGSDDSIFRVATMSSATVIATGSWEKVGAQATFTSGCEIDLDHSAAAVTTLLATKADSSHTHAATDIGSGAVSNTEFGYLDGVTSAIQTQFADKLSLSETADQYPTGAVVLNKLGMNVDAQDFNAGTTLTLDDTVNLIGQYLAPPTDGCIVELGTATRGTVYVFTHVGAGIGPITITDTPGGIEPVLIGYGQTSMFVYLGGWTCVTGAATAPDFGGETVYHTPGTYTGATAFTVPAIGVSQYEVIVVAGGGGGGAASGSSSNAAAGGGGGAGGGIRGVINVVAGETLTITVGDGGAGGTSSGSGSTGGNSSIVRDSDSSTLAIAYGGSGGAGMVFGTTVAVAIGGAASSASVTGDAAATTQAQAGDPGLRFSGTVAVSGAGGMALAGAGTSGRTGSANGYTTSGGTDAGGGGGGAVSNSATGRTGGKGCEGIVILRPLR